MADTIRLQPHDPLPDPPFVAVLRRFDEDDARRVITEIVLRSASSTQIVRPTRPDGEAMAFDDAISHAAEVADSEKIATVHAIDRTAGDREQDILQHGGDHTVHMEQLDDSDMEDGERGPDMRDVMHDTRVQDSGTV